MRAVKFKSVLWGAALRMGLDPSRNLLNDQAATLTEYINSRVREGWEFQDWPAVCPTEERVPDGDFVIALNQGFLTPIGEVFGVFAANPDKVRHAKELIWELRAQGIQLFQAVESCWVTYRRLPPLFTSEPWLPGKSYVPGDLVYKAGEGDCFKCKVANLNVDVLDVGFWERVLFPDFLGEFVKAGVFSDALREQGQPEKAAVEESRAEQLLMREADKVGLQVGRVARYGARV
jgi:hypothetical protein